MENGMFIHFPSNYRKRLNFKRNFKFFFTLLFGVVGNATKKIVNEKVCVYSNVSS